MTNKSKDTLKLPSYGGQALIEGVLMRGSKYVAVAMRAPSGEIVVQTESLKGIYTSRIAKLPFLRGLVILWDAIGLGTKYLTISANLQAGDDEKIEGKAMFFSLVFSFLFAIGLFFLAPAGLAALFEKWFFLSPFFGNMVEGFVRLGLVILYMWGIGKMADIKRVFSYHGAEHKTINAFEASIPLEPERVSLSSTYHPRCGTGFVVTLVVFSVILFTILGPLPSIWIRLASRVILLPVLIMIAYEYMRFSAMNLAHPVLKYLSSINMTMQKLTTVEPTKEMLEVSIKAFKTMYELENSE